MREKREHQRVSLKVAVTLEGKMATTWSAESQDISVGGIFLVGTPQPSIGTEVELVFELPGLGPVRLPGFVRWTKVEGYGVQFGLLGAKETHAIGKLVHTG